MISVRVGLTSDSDLWVGAGTSTARYAKGMSTRLLLVLSLLCGIAILGAFALQLLLI